MSAPDLLAEHDIALVRANNPGPFTLSGTNTWVAGRAPCWVIDPGPALDDHLAAILAEVAARGGAGGIALTHGHADHTDGLAALVRETGAPVAAMAFAADVALADGASFGPLTAIATPGHAPDHLAFVFGTACFTGDAVLGEGSVFVAPDPGALRGYLAALERLRGMGLELLCPGHGPPVADPAAKIDHYVSHRLDRERRLVAALDDGLRGAEDLLDRVWDDVAAGLRPAAAVTLAAHLDKLAEEGRLPDGVERPPGF
ncbi:MAG: beta-lactamase domain protein [Solirubrobacterales bacterium]|nr:beta-lactamase domain protein [Solirubrobacterales bacterium]